MFLYNYSCLITTLSPKAIIYTVIKVGGGIAQDPTTEVTHLGIQAQFLWSHVL